MKETKQYWASVCIAIVLSGLITAVALNVPFTTAVNETQSFRLELDTATVKLAVSEEYTFTVTPSGGIEPYSYQWTVGTGDSSLEDYYSLEVDGATATFVFLKATDEPFLLTVEATDSMDTVAQATAVIFDPYSHPHSFMTIAYPYAYMIQADGLGWYRAIDQNGLVYSTSTNQTSLMDTCLTAMSDGILYLDEVAWNTSLTIPENSTVIEQLDGELTRYINSADLQGSRITVTVSGSTYYARDTEDSYINDWVSTNATTVIDNAMTNGQVVQLGVGTFVVDQVTLETQKILSGSGKNVTILKLRDGANQDVITLPTAGSRSSRGVICDLQVDGNKANNPTNGNGISLYSIWKYTVERVFILNCRENGLFLSGQASPLDSLENVFNDIEIASCEGSGLKTGYTYDSDFTNIYTEHNTEDGFALYSGSNSFISCHAYDCRYGFYMSTGVGDSVFYDCWGDTNYQHGFCVEGNNLRITNCYSFNNGQDGANTYDGIYLTSNAYKVTLMGNRIYDSQGTKTQRYGLKVDGDSNLVVSNYLSDNSWGGMNIGGGTSGNVIELNSGYVTENEGTQTCANTETIAHGLAGTPTYVSVESMNATYDGVGVTVGADWDGTNITMEIKWTNGTAISDDTILVCWKAKYQP